VRCLANDFAVDVAVNRLLLNLCRRRCREHQEQ
jgi:hypothetical protein